MATWLLSPLGDGTTPLAQALALHSTEWPPPPGPQRQRTGIPLCPGLVITPRVGGWMEAETDRWAGVCTGGRTDGCWGGEVLTLPGSPYPCWQGWGSREGSMSCSHGMGQHRVVGNTRPPPALPWARASCPQVGPHHVLRECPHTAKSEILTGIAQRDHGRVPTHQGTRKTDAEGAQQHSRDGQWTLAGPLSVAIPQGEKKETGGTGIQPQPRFKTGSAGPYNTLILSALTQNPSEASGSPKAGLGPMWVPPSSVWQCQGTEGMVEAQPASASSCPSVCPYPCAHADFTHAEVYPRFHVHVCTHVRAPCHHWLCPHTMVLHP